MNAQNIWAGTDYAWMANSARSQRFTLKCERVRVRRVTKEKVASNQNATTFVVVQFLDRDTGEVIDRQSSYGVEGKIVEGENTFYKVRAYDFVDYWENVEDEYAHKVAEQRRIDAEREVKEREAKERRERIERERQQRFDDVKNFLIGRGVDPSWIKYVKQDNSYYGDSGIRLSFDAVENAMKAAQDGDGRTDVSVVPSSIDAILDKGW